MATTLTPAAPWSLLPLQRTRPTGEKEGGTRWRERLPLFLVVLAALGLAAFQYTRFVESHRHLWFCGTHDRNAHYFFSLKLAADLRGGHLLRWLEDVNGARVWPPFQDILASFALLVGGNDDRLVVWPSIAGWALTMIFGFLVARRLVPRGGNLAGAVAVLFIAVSPSHQAFAADAMLESLGAGLTLAALYAYLVAVQGNADGERTGRWLGLALTILFLDKYNYWLLVVLALAGAEAIVRRHDLWRVGSMFLKSRAWRGLIRTQLSTISNYAILAIVGVVLIVYAHGDRPFVWRGREVSLYPPYNIVQIAYWIAFVRLLFWWRSAGHAWADGLDVRLRQVIRWHLWPAAWWMALPKHVGPFLWYLSPAQGAPEQRPTLLDGIRQYAAWAVSDYHLSVACLLVAATLLVLGLLALPWAKRGGAAVAIFFLLALFLTVSHPNQQPRFLTSWIATGWIFAGVGLAALIYGRLTARIAMLRPALACTALAAIGVVQANGDWSIRVPNAGPHPELPSLVDVTDSYLPDLAGKQTVAILSDVAIGPMAQWTFLERYGSLDRLEDHRFAFGPLGAANRQAFRAWLKSTRVETLVFIEALPGPQVQIPWENISELPLHAELRGVLSSQQDFGLVRRQEFPRQGCAVAVWIRHAGE